MMSSNIIEPPVRKPPIKTPPRLPPIPPKVNNDDGWGGRGPYKNFKLRLLFTIFFLFWVFVFLMSAFNAYDHKYIILSYILEGLGVASYSGFLISYIMLIDCIED